jgi:hypothetical protein
MIVTVPSGPTSVFAGAHHFNIGNLIATEIHGEDKVRQSKNQCVIHSRFRLIHLILSHAIAF